MKVKINNQCPGCSKQYQSVIDVEPVQLAPVTKSNIFPMSNVFIYRITSEQIKHYLIDKARKYSPDIKMEVVPRFIEKKRKKPGEVHGAYASLRIAFSENIIEKNAENGWFGKIGESDNVRIINTIFQNFIKMYDYKKEDLKKIRNDYKKMEDLEETLGITESYLDDLIMFSTPRLIKTATGDNWVFFSAAAEKVIFDMLTISENNELPGRIVIQDIVQISRDSVEYLVYLYPDKLVQEDPSVRRILLGEEKAKRN